MPGETRTMADDREYFRSTCDDGVIELFIPRQLSPEEVAEFEQWLALILRRRQRNATLPSDKSQIEHITR